jgi:amino acid transporter
LILAVTFVGLLQVFNGNFVTASRLLFAYGRRGTVPLVFARIHERHLTPVVAISGITLAALAGLLVGDALLVPVTEVGSMASAFGWMAACLSFYMVERRPWPRLVAAMGVVVSLLLVLMKWIPGVPGHFTVAEWIALAVWFALGLLMRRRPGTA